MFKLTLLLTLLLLLVPDLTWAQASQFIPCEGASCQTCDLVKLANSVIKWLIGILFLFFAVLAVTAGVKLVISGGNPSAKQSAKSSFTNAFIGLFIVLGAWLLVDTIMRGLIGGNGDIKGYGPWAKVECSQDAQTDAKTEDLGIGDLALSEPMMLAAGETFVAGSGATNLSLKGGGTVPVVPCDGGSGGRQTIPFLGKSVTVQKNLVPSLRRIDAKWKQMGGNSFYKITTMGGYNCRKVTGGTGYSNHSYGLSIDINYKENPYQANNVLVTNMPPAFVKLFTDEGWGWGGRWRSKKDAMHFSKARNEQGDMRGE